MLRGSEKSGQNSSGARLWEENKEPDHELAGLYEEKSGYEGWSWWEAVQFLAERNIPDVCNTKSKFEHQVQKDK